ncbi:MAG: NusG domain II-containing protein [Treponema sp.]|nr:NusG domain II-containing protein [Treponema sp.]
MKALKVFRPLDPIIFAIILILAIFMIKKSLSPKSGTVHVEANGKSYEYSLDKDGTFQVEGALGLTTFEIKNKAVRIIDSPCPNKTCVHQRWANPLVCLPNRVIITIEDYGEFDAISE